MNRRPRMYAMAPLFHFTCDDHGYTGITTERTIRGQRHPLFPHLGPLVWLTELEQVDDPMDVGLTSDRLTCDRTSRRFLVTCRAAVPWASVRGRVNPRAVADLEAFGRPDTWWVV